MPLISEAASRLVGQKMFQILKQAQDLEQQGHEMLHFEIGEPDFPTPARITARAIEALQAGDTRYAPSSGLLDLREAAAKTTSGRRSFVPSISQVLVTPGANVQIYLALACIINRGDEVVISDPSFVSYSSIINFLGGHAIRIPLSDEDNFRVHPSAIEAAITSRTKVIIINSPCNPTGSVMGPDDAKAIFNIAHQKNVYLMSDEIYSRIVYEDDDTKFHSPCDYDHCKSTTILIDGFSKAHSMTGWRLGIVIGPTDLITKMGLLLETILSCTPPFIQRAGIEALKGEQGEVAEMVAEYRKRRDLLVSGLNSLPGFYCSLPKGAFYAFPNIKGTGLTSSELASRLMHEAGVVVCPGDIFGPSGEGYLRFCFATSLSNIERAIIKMQKML